VRALIAAGETFQDFESLACEAVLHRAKKAEESPRGAQGVKLPANGAAWRRLYRELRRAGASTVADLETKAVEEHAERLGYGYFIRYGRHNKFMPFEGR
jgi:hypothetical protein